MADIAYVLFNNEDEVMAVFTSHEAALDYGKQAGLKENEGVIIETLIDPKF